ncbi:MAG: Tex family protein, partial [Oscillospiraceae bacterium]|nr:Tex family protein [Oscillospiraceae bacterium]
DEGNTIPFIARYRKELTGSMDDQVLRELSERLAYLRALDARREEVKKSIAEQEKLTAELAAAIDAAATLAEIEDLYRPYKPKRRTRASIAREKGLEPLADYLLAQSKNADPSAKAAEYIDAEKGVADAESALAGARDIIAENLSDSADIRKELRRIIRTRGSVSAKAAKEEDSVYRNYYDYTEPVGKIQSHRVLAINRGEREGFLKVSVDIPREESVGMIEKTVVKNDSPCKAQLQLAAADSFDRLIAPSVEREIRSELTDAADEQAIKTFGLNLKPLLMQPPVKDKVTLGLDPAYRTGCKIAVVDGTGKVLATSVIYPTPPHNKVDEAREKINGLIRKYDVDVVSIGNGTASRESEQFVADTIKGTPVKYMIVSEAGASVYSASKLAANEFPDYDVSLRSAVSIARRLQDPLAELVKIDPKSIGVGQYQHDMPPAQLDAALGGVVEDCVNAVGVDLNTASPSLLSYVAGVNAGVSKNIVAYREENGAFRNRKELLKVPKLGKTAFVQCAGFLRIPGAKNPLDNTGVHPESYAAAEQLLALCGYSLADVSAGTLGELPDRLAAHGEAAAAAACGVGVPTLRDIVKELMKPGRDPRDELPPPVLRSDVLSMDDLLPGMELTGTVRNVVDFGAFVDIGVHEDGLVHISRMATRYIKHPSDVVKTGDVVRVWVLDVDKAKKRISLTMLPPQEKAPAKEK